MKVIFAGRVAVAVLLAWVLCSGGMAVAGVNVVVSIKPLHSLASAVMQGAGQPHLLLRGNASPHSYRLKPSDARALQRAQIVFWTGPGLEVFLDKPLVTLAGRAKIVRLIDAPGMVRLQARAGGLFADHKDEHDAPGHAGPDMHIWLDPDNAKAMVRAIARVLGGADPVNADLYRANRDKTLARIAQLDAMIKVRLAKNKAVPFVVFHDSYQYFERHFSLSAAASMSVNPAIAPGARRLSRIRNRLQALATACVFTEPQYPSGLVRAIVQGTGAKTETLDPLGARLKPGPELYFELVQAMAGSFARCFADAGG